MEQKDLLVLSAALNEVCDPDNPPSFDAATIVVNAFLGIKNSGKLSIKVKKLDLKTSLPPTQILVRGLLKTKKMLNRLALVFMRIVSVSGFCSFTQIIVWR